jgi:predicted extracellular nuclease
VAQIPLRIYDIQGTGSMSPYNEQQVVTDGVVTAVFQKTNSIGGFYIQDTVGDGNENTSDAIFVYSNTAVSAGDYVEVSGTAGEYNSQTQISNSSVTVLKSGVKIPFAFRDFPLDFQDNRERFEGMAFILTHSMYIMSVSDLTRYGQVHLASRLLRAGTDQALPLSAEYNAALQWNAIDDIILDDASTRNNPTPTPYTDQDGSMRTSRYCDSLHCIFAQQGETYMLYPAVMPVFYGNPRTAAPSEAALGDYTLKVCGFNLEHYYNESDLQRTRLVKAISAIDADLYGFCEVIQDNTAIQTLVNAMNAAKGSDVYAYIPLHTASGTYDVVDIVYRTDKLTPYKNSIKVVQGVQNRKFIQAFQDNSSGEIFIFSINHFKAKSGTGTGANADQGDGQGIYNYDRKLEAQALVSKFAEMKYYYETQRMIIMGDLNALHYEDPIMILRNAGFNNQTYRFDTNQYSYRFRNAVQYLDYSLTSDSLTQYVTGATVWHINADEPSSLGWERSSNTDVYRCSDHDPVIVGLRLPSGGTGIAQNATSIKRALLYPNPASDLVTVFCVSNKIAHVNVLSTAGTRVLSVAAAADDNEVTLNVSSLARGLYIVQVVLNDGSVVMKKLQAAK